MLGGEVFIGYLDWAGTAGPVALRKLGLRWNEWAWGHSAPFGYRHRLAECDWNPNPNAETNPGRFCYGLLVLVLKTMTSLSRFRPRALTPPR